MSIDPAYSNKRGEDAILRHFKKVTDLTSTLILWKNISNKLSNYYTNTVFLLGGHGGLCKAIWTSLYLKSICCCTMTR